MVFREQLSTESSRRRDGVKSLLDKKGKSLNLIEYINSDLFRDIF